MTPDGWFVGGIAAAALFLDFVLHLVGGTWILARSRGELAKELAEQIKEQKKEIDKELFGLRQEFSDTFKAIRQSLADLGKDINRVELESYKNFVRRDSFFEVMKSQNELVSEQIKKLDNKVDQLDKFTRAIPQQLVGSK
jgi:hypothetical protein